MPTTEIIHQGHQVETGPVPNRTRKETMLAFIDSFVAGEYQPGQPLPAIDALKTRYSTSRHIISETKRELKKRGLIVSQGSKSSIAPTIDQEALSEFKKEILASNDQSLQEWVAAHMLTEIGDGRRFPPGSQTASLAQLREQFDVSTVTIRKARELLGDVLVPKADQGYFVRERGIEPDERLELEEALGPADQRPTSRTGERFNPHRKRTKKRHGTTHVSSPWQGVPTHYFTFFDTAGVGNAPTPIILHVSGNSPTIHPSTPMFHISGLTSPDQTKPAQTDIPAPEGVRTPVLAQTADVFVAPVMSEHETISDVAQKISETLEKSPLNPQVQEQEPLALQLASRLQNVITELHPGTSITDSRELAAIANVPPITARAALTQLRNARLILDMPDFDPFVVRTQPQPDLSLSTHLQDAIAVGIETGLLEPGMPLPPQQTLAKYYGESKWQIQTAYQKLGKRGLLNTNEPRVTRVSGDYISDAKRVDIYLRELLTQLSKGEKLPGRPAIAEKLGVFPGVVERQLKHLKRERLVTTDKQATVATGRGFISPDQRQVENGKPEEQEEVHATQETKPERVVTPRRRILREPRTPVTAAWLRSEPLMSTHDVRFAVTDMVQQSARAVLGDELEKEAIEHLKLRGNFRYGSARITRPDMKRLGGDAFMRVFAPTVASIARAMEWDAGNPQLTHFSLLLYQRIVSENLRRDSHQTLTSLQRLTEKYMIDQGLQGIEEQNYLLLGLLDIADTKGARQVIYTMLEKPSTRENGFRRIKQELERTKEE